MLNNFRAKLIAKQLYNFRLLNIAASVIVTILGFIFEFAFHDGLILTTGLICSMVLISNYFLSYYSSFYQRHFTDITLFSIFIVHLWAVYITFVRDFETGFLLPLSISIFTFSLIFDKFHKSLAFIFTITTCLLILMIWKGNWQPIFSITLIALYAGAFFSKEILKRKAEFYSEIQKQEKRYVNLVENMNDGLIYLGKDRKIEYINDKFCLITGYSKKELLSSGIFMVFPELFFDKIFSGKSSPSNSGSVKNDVCMKKKSGEIIWVHTTASPHFDNDQLVGLLLVCTDISQLKFTQEALKKREEGYRTFIDQSAVGIWRADYPVPVSVNLPIEEQIDQLLNTGIISECNDFMAMMYGYTNSSELIGRRISDFYHIENKYDDEKTRELFKNFIENNYRISNAESKELDNKGVIRYMLNNNIGIIENGALIRTWGVQTDITERKRTEKELLETNQELDTFFYKASHDLKGPLASVMGIVNLARLENNDSVSGKYFDMIETSVRRLDNTLLDLIEIARTRKGSDKFSQINVRDFIEEIIFSLKHVPNFGLIHFEKNIAPGLTITADKVLMLSVFQNLIHNAINYCIKKNPMIKIFAEETFDGIEVVVEDNGKGISESITDKVFNMFYRGNAESTGSGLGLFIVKNALEKMKGTIHLNSREGSGTTFTVKIPAAILELI